MVQKMQRLATCLPPAILFEKKKRSLTKMMMTRIAIRPSKHGISEYYSLNMLVAQKVLDYEKHCQHEFGEYIQAMHENDPTNVMTERSIDGIYLHPNTNQQGGHVIMNINTGKIITRGRIVTVPLSKTIKDAVKQMAHRQGFKKMKYSNKNGMIIPNMDWDAKDDYKLDILGIVGPTDEADDNRDMAYKRRTEPYDTNLVYDDNIDEDKLMDLHKDKIPESEPEQQQLTPTNTN